MGCARDSVVSCSIVIGFSVLVDPHDSSTHIFKHSFVNAGEAIVTHMGKPTCAKPQISTRHEPCYDFFRFALAWVFPFQTISKIAPWSALMHFSYECSRSPTSIILLLMSSLCNICLYVRSTVNPLNIYTVVFCDFCDLLCYFNFYNTWIRVTIYLPMCPRVASKKVRINKNITKLPLYPPKHRHFA